MDFLQSLLLYMATTVALTVQGAEAPENMPMPTVAPTAIVTEAIEPTQPMGTIAVGESQITVTPSITVTPTPIPEPTEEPEPTITPNRRYRNLANGSKGNDVRNLQRALADLGYLSGNIDGSYGAQTRNAVMKFQQYNGLTVDGVAGDATQTRLFEDPQVVPNPETVTASPVPTATPGPDGLIPTMEDPRSIWVEKQNAVVLMNGVQLEDKVGIWLRGSEMIVSLSDLAASSTDWTIVAEDASHCLLTVMGNTIEAMLMPAVAATQQGNEYSDYYALIVNGQTLDAKQGAWMQEDGTWYATVTCLTDALHADITWDEDEKTLVVRVLTSELSQAED